MTSPRQRLGLRKAHFGLAHHEPLAARPGAGGVHEFRPIEDAPRGRRRCAERVGRGDWVDSVRENQMSMARHE